MIRNIFFDLDGTLLGMDVRQFMRLYVSALSVFLSKKGHDGEKMARAVLGGTKVMLTHDGTRTNSEVFWDSFCSETGVPIETMLPLMVEFYTGDFAIAREATYAFAESAEIVRLLKAKGLRIFLTTNAVFPVEANRTRLAWAGLNPTDFEYITLYDNMHACKPNASYFAEVFDRFNLDPKETLLIGNDREEDCCIETLGAECILLSENLFNLKNLPLENRRVMTHAELLEKIQSGELLAINN